MIPLKPNGLRQIIVAFTCQKKLKTKKKGSLSGLRCILLQEKRYKPGFRCSYYPSIGPLQIRPRLGERQNSSYSSKKTALVDRAVTWSSLEREVWVSNLGPVKLDAVLQTARHRSDISKEVV